LTKRDFPRIRFYDQDFVDLYDRTQVWLSDCFSGQDRSGVFGGKFFCVPGSTVIEQADAVYSSFFLSYSNRIYPAQATLDIFYDKQEASGAIRQAYHLADGAPVLSATNPEGLYMPLFGWAEFNLYHKTGNKKRIKEVLPVLDRYVAWLEENFLDENGLFRSPLESTGMINSPREEAVYLVDFNSAAAINVLYMSAMADILNDKEMAFNYKRRYFALKTRINNLMWDNDEGFYYDINHDEHRLPARTIAGYWPLLAEIPNEDKAERMIEKLTDPAWFGTPHPFPSLAVSEPHFDDFGGAYHGSVYPHLNYMVLKGLERYKKYDLARECAIRHFYFILDSMDPTGNHHRGKLWEAYNPIREGASIWADDPDFPRAQYYTYAALSTICLTIENIIGMSISLPRKTVDWVIPNLEAMGIENLSLKKNLITIISNRSGHGWEIHMESEKLYYFTLNILGQKKKTLPIPSGKCSMLIDKL
jgi:neutral trehalase